MSRSLFVMKRAGLKLSLFVLIAGAEFLLGQSFARPLASLSAFSASLSVLFGLHGRERLLARHYTSFDEAAWFSILACLLNRSASL